MEEYRDNIDDLIEWCYFIDMLDIINTLYNLSSVTLPTIHTTQGAGLSHDIMEEFKYSWLSAYEKIEDTAIKKSLHKRINNIYE